MIFTVRESKGRGITCNHSRVYRQAGQFYCTLHTGSAGFIRNGIALFVPYGKKGIARTP